MKFFSKLKEKKAIYISSSKKISKWIFSISVLSFLLMAITIFSLITGSSNMSLAEVYQGIFSSTKTVQYSIIFDIRLPRILLALAVGGALSIAGVIYQGLFQNPLVEPYTIGISGGAALGVSISIILGLAHIFGFFMLPLAGFIGANVSLSLVYSLSMKKGIIKTNGLLLIGVMVSFISSSLIMLIIALARKEKLHEIIFWTMGSLGESSWLLIKLVLIVSIIGLILSLFFCLDLNAITLGEENAKNLGVHVERSKHILFFIASVLTGVSVSIAGIISFVGLVVPHFMRIIVGSDHRILIMSSFLSGAIFLIFCDTLARTVISPSELPVGVITGFLGGTLFIYALSKKKKFYV